MTLLALLSTNSAMATTLVSHGTVLVNQGAGFVAIGNTLPLRSGDVIAVNQGYATLFCSNDQDDNSLKDDRHGRTLLPGRTYSVDELCSAAAGTTPVTSAPSLPAAGIAAAAGVAAIVGGVIAAGTDGTGRLPTRRPTSP